MRLIDADALKYAIEKRIENINSEEFAEGMSEAIIEIDFQPTIIPEHQWIPCSKWLPETHIEDEIEFMGEKIGEYRLSAPVLGYVQGMDDDVDMAVVWYEDDLDGRTAWQIAPDCIEVNVVAWMPLPEPYKEGEQDDKNT